MPMIKANSYLDCCMIMWFLSWKRYFETTNEALEVTKLSQYPSEVRNSPTGSVQE